MADATDKRAVFIQNLQDAGFGQQMIGQCLMLAGQGRKEELLQLLARQKRELMDIVHKNQDQVDCLDFLVYQIRQGNLYENFELDE